MPIPVTPFHSHILHGFLPLPVDVVSSIDREPCNPASAEEQHMPVDTFRYIFVDRCPTGYGGSSDVYKGRLLMSDNKFLFVAIKVLRAHASERFSLSKRLEHEVRCWKTLQHKNIASLYGLYHQVDCLPGLVSPWYQEGTVDAYLKNHPDIDRMNMIKEIADGLEYLHSMAVVHGDLKPANILVSDEGVPKIIDFGISRILNESGFTTSHPLFTMRWCAPELISSPPSRTSKESDIYAFASTISQILSGYHPYQSINSACILWEIYHTRRLPYERDQVDCSDELWRLLESCWAESSLRPNIQEMKDRLAIIE